MNELLKQCRYYSGQKVCPYKDSNLVWFWDMERVFVQSGGEFTGERVYFNKLIGPDEFPGVPRLLLLIMFTSWGKSGDMEGSIQEFRDLVKEYLFVANDHFPEDKVPG